MKRPIQIRRIIRIPIPIRHNTRVHTRAITMPNLKESLRDRFARLDVDDLDVESQRNALLIVSDVFADKFALDPVGTLGYFGAEHAAVVAREDDTWIGIGGDAG